VVYVANDLDVLLRHRRADIARTVREERTAIVGI
jgi:hypothetical protein